MRLQIILFVLTSLVLAGESSCGQNSLTLTLSSSNPTNPSEFFDGFAFRVGTAIGDASTYARFTGSGGTRSFQIDSPGEAGTPQATRTVTADGFFNIRPVVTMVISSSLIKNFNGSHIVGSNSVTVKDMSLTTSGVSPSSGAPGTGVTITYLTNGAGTIPGVVSFKTQILVNNTWQDMPNSATQYPNTARENVGYSKGEPRIITANVPSGLSAGIYQIRVVTTGANQTVVSTTTTFTVTVPFTINAPTITTPPNSAGYYCPASPVQVTFSTNGSSNTGNTYRVELSKPDGTFPSNNFLPITGPSTGTTLSVALNLLNDEISSDYRIRIVSTNPAVTSSSSAKYNINRPSGPGKTGYGEFLETSLNFCQGQSFPAITPTATNGASSSSFVWYNATGQEIFRGSSYSPTAAGTYQVQQKALECGSVWSRYFVTLAPSPALNISLSDGTNTFPGEVYIGGNASIALRATNFSKWSASYKDDVTGTFVALDNTPTEQPVRWIYPNFATASVRNYGASDISGFRNEGACPNGSVSGTVRLNIKEMNLAIGTLSGSAICPGQPISAQWTINDDGQAPQGGRFLLELLRADGSVIRELPTTGGPSPDLFNNLYVARGAANTQLRATIPDDVPEGQYKLRVAFKAPNNSYSRQSGASSGSFQVSRPIAPTVSNPPTICQGQSAPNLVSFVQANGQLRWYNEAGSLVNAPTPSNTQSSKWFVAISNGACESDRRQIDVNVTAKPVVPQITTSTDNVCQGAGSITLSASGNDLTWRDNNNVESKSAPVISTINATTYTYRVRQNVGGCTSDETTVSVTVKPRPAAPTPIPPAPICQYVSNAPTLTATSSTNGSLRWYTQSTGNAGQSDQAPRPNTELSGNQSFYVSQIINGCESTDRATVTQAVNAAPARPTPPPIGDLLRCQDETGRPLSVTAATGNTLRWYNADTGQSLPNPAQGQSTAPTPTMAVGVQTYYVTQTDGNGCQSLQQPVSTLHTA